MTDPQSDPGIPTLTELAAIPGQDQRTIEAASPAPGMTDRLARADPPVSPSAGAPTQTQTALPVLTEALNAAQGTLPPESVLRAALQAELEHTIQTALEQATADVMRQVRRQLEDELPGVVDRVISRLRPG